MVETAQRGERAEARDKEKGGLITESRGLGDTVGQSVVPSVGHLGRRG